MPNDFESRPEDEPKVEDEVTVEASPVETAPKAAGKPHAKQTFCERCGEPCGNEPVCATCLAR